MQDMRIDVSQVEEWQTLKDVKELERLFEKAQSTIVNGAAVVLYRKTAGRKEPFQTIDNLEDLKQYRNQVMKYLP